jgi:predicted ATP-grasp superfamily ATP-dependent carboligase
VVLGADHAFVIEINPRLTTAYVGLRAAFGANLAALILAACDGRRAPLPRPERRVRFSSTGRIRAA